MVVITLIGPFGNLWRNSPALLQNQCRPDIRTIAGRPMLAIDQRSLFLLERQIETTNRQEGNGWSDQHERRWCCRVMTAARSFVARPRSIIKLNANRRVSTRVFRQRHIAQWTPLWLDGIPFPGILNEIRRQMIAMNHSQEISLCDEVSDFLHKNQANSTNMPYLHYE